MNPCMTNATKTGNRKCWNVVELPGGDIIRTRLTRKEARREADGLIRAYPCLEGFHFAPCQGEAHRPDVAGMIDNCMLCAPEWGVVMVSNAKPVAWGCTCGDSKHHETA